MQVTEEKDYNPITITLNTKREADVLFNILNCGYNMSMKEYCEHENFDFTADEKSEYGTPFMQMFYKKYME